MKITRAWCMPNHNTLSMKPVYEFFMRHKGVFNTETFDPFARDCELCNYTNDLNPNTKAKDHMKADEWIKKFERMKFVVFDPPYSLRQVKECYEGVGVGFTHKDTQNAIRWTIERDLISERQQSGDKVMSLGWSSTCMGKKRGYEIEEILLVSHGAAHNDTIVTLEVKL